MADNYEEMTLSEEERQIAAIRRDRYRAYWRANTKLIRNLLIIWALASLVCGILLVPLLNNIQIGNVPLGFWMAQQGAIFIFVILIFVYAIAMDKLDRKYRQ